MSPARLRRLGHAALLLAAVALPIALPDDYVVSVATRVCLYAMLALGLNIVVGFAGLLDIGYVAFFGIGSYVYAFLASPHFGIHLPTLLILPVIIAAATVAGIVIGGPTLRLRGDYLAIVTLGFGEITYLLLLNLDRPVDITGGPNGIISIDAPSLLGFTASRNVDYYYLFLAVLLLVLLISVRLRDSQIGWAWQAIREDELAAEAMGVNTTVAKLQAFVIGASFAGVAGGLLASWQRSVFPDNFLLQESINILAMVILGGMGSVLGVILGAAIIVIMPEAFRELALYRLLAFGLLLMVLMIFRPQGLWPARTTRRAKRVVAPGPLGSATPPGPPGSPTQ